MNKITIDDLTNHHTYSDRVYPWGTLIFRGSPMEVVEHINHIQSDNPGRTLLYFENIGNGITEIVEWDWEELLN